MCPTIKIWSHWFGNKWKWILIKCADAHCTACYLFPSIWGHSYLFPTVLGLFICFRLCLGIFPVYNCFGTFYLFSPPCQLPCQPPCPPGCRPPCQPTCSITPSPLLSPIIIVTSVKCLPQCRSPYQPTCPPPCWPPHRPPCQPPCPPPQSPMASLKYAFNPKTWHWRSCQGCWRFRFWCPAITRVSVNRIWRRTKACSWGGGEGGDVLTRK